MLYFSMSQEVTHDGEQRAHSMLTTCSILFTNATGGVKL